MDEFSFIDEIKQSYYRQPSLIKGIGDDGAVTQPNGQNVVFVKDMFVEGIHFAAHTMSPFHIGYKSLAANISDLAAMGAQPAFYLVAISIPKEWPLKKIATIFQGMKRLANKYQMDLIGGDTVSGSELVISITAIGYAEDNKARYRSDASVGDIVFVTGTLGDSQAGLHILNNPGAYLDESYYLMRHQMPSPRVEFALELIRLPRLSLNDISDGIASEVHEIADASKVTIVIQENKIPVHSSYGQFDTNKQFKWKLFGGEDFELVGTVPKQHWNCVQEAATLHQIKVSKIGYVVEQDSRSNVLLQLENGKKVSLQKDGYNHLSR